MSHNRIPARGSDEVLCSLGSLSLTPTHAYGSRPRALPSPTSTLDSHQSKGPRGLQGFRGCYSGGKGMRRTCHSAARAHNVSRGALPPGWGSRRSVAYFA